MRRTKRLDVAYPDFTVRRERRWTTVGAIPTRELDRSTR